MDSFTNTFSPEIGRDAVTVLENAGYQVVLTRRAECCGLTWISTGQLDTAKRLLHRTVTALAPFERENVPIIGLEPSCTAVLRSDLPGLLPDDPRAHRIARNTFTLAEFLTAPNARYQDRWRMPSLDGVRVLVQPHCHQHSVMGFETDRQLLAGAGASVEVIAGCCGLAGNFGMERGHYDMSVSVAENGLLPALRRHADSDTAFLADGFSCRTQAEHLAARPGSHLVELIAEQLRRP